MKKEIVSKTVCRSCNTDIDKDDYFCRTCGRFRWTILGVRIRRWEIFLVSFLLVFLLASVNLTFPIQGQQISTTYPSATRSQLPPTKSVPFITNTTSTMSTNIVIPTKTQEPTATVIIPNVTDTKYATISNKVYFANLRRSPGYLNKEDSEDSITEVPQGAELNIIDGPEKADGISWWYVEWKNYRGWIAEHTASGKTILVFDP